MQETVIDLSAIGRAIKNRRYLIGSSFLGTILIVSIINFLIPPTFEAETTIRVKQPKGLLSSTLLAEMTGSSSNIKQLMSTYSEILKSRTVVQMVIDKTLSDEPSVPKYEKVLSRITTQPIKDTEILKIKVTAKSPTEAQLIANTLVGSFTDRLTSLVRAEQSAVREFIGERVVEARKELDRGEEALEQYKSDQKILTPSDETKAMVERMAYMKKLSADNVVASATAGAKLNSAERQLAQESPGLIADSPLIQLYKAKLADLEVELVSLSQNFGNKHPKIMATRGAIDETRARLALETNQVIHSQVPSLNPIHQGLLQSKIQNEAELSAAAAQKVAIGRVMAESEQEMTKLPAKEQGISRLTRDVMVAQEIYIMLANRYEEARISEVAQPSDVQVIDVAVAPEFPIYPRKALNVAVGGMLGLFLGLGLAFFLEYSQRTIQNSQEAKQYLGLPVLGVIPDYSLATVTTGNGPVERIQAFFGKSKQSAEEKNKKIGR